MPDEDGTNEREEEGGLRVVHAVHVNCAGAPNAWSHSIPIHGEDEKDDDDVLVHPSDSQGEHIHGGGRLVWNGAWRSLFLCISVEGVASSSSLETSTFSFSSSAASQMSNHV